MNQANIEQVEITAGAGNDAAVVFSQPAGQLFSVFGGEGNDSFHNGSLTGEGVRGQVRFYGDGGADNRVVLNDVADATGDTFHITQGTIGALPGDDFFGPGGSLSFSSVQRIDITCSQGTDTVYAQPNAATVININGSTPSASPGDTLNLALAAAQNPVITGTTSGNVTSDNLQTLNWAGFEEAVGVDDVAPAVVIADINVDGVDAPGRNGAKRQSIDVQFSEDVSLTIEQGWLELTNLTTGEVVPAGYIAVTYDSATNTAHFTFPGYANGVLPDGNYAGRIHAGLPDLFGNGMPADAPFEFFFLNGDANHDGSVDVADLGILASNWQQTGATFSQADFNYDGSVDVADLGILASKWQGSLPMPSLPFTSGGSTPTRGTRAARMTEVVDSLV
jgi:hypothetical protein